MISEEERAIKTLKKNIDEYRHQAASNKGADHAQRVSICLYVFVLCVCIHTHIYIDTHIQTKCYMYMK